MQDKLSDSPLCNDMVTVADLHFSQFFSTAIQCEINSKAFSRGGGALTLERGMGMCRGHDPLFSGQSPLPSPPIYLNAPLLCPLFSIFRKFLHFQPCFGQNSSSLDPNFSKFSFSRPPFFQENPLPRPYILKPAWYTPTKKKVELPPRGRFPRSVVKVGIIYNAKISVFRFNLEPRRI